jgi:ParB family chromosome partitioning protein
MKLSDIVISKQNVRDLEDTGEEFENLKTSIKKDSLIQKIVLRPSKEKDKYEVVAGGRRFRALKAIHPETYELQETEYVLYPEMDDTQALLWSIEENTQRLAFSPLTLNKAGLILNQKGLKDKDIAQKLNVTVYRLKRILDLSADFHKMPDTVKQELAKLPEDSKLTDAHWDKISKELEDKEVIQEVADYIIEKEVPAKEVPSIIKMVANNRKAAGKDSPEEETVIKDKKEEDAGSIEYSHKGELVMEEKAGKMVFKVLGKGEDEEVPVDQYLNYLRNPGKFKCYVTFKMKVQPIE